jgi:fructose-1,6-bisphosphatase/sedoheptulose 1,7-bisphosphatase-like protein
MISKVPDIKNTDNDKQRQIEIKEAQLKIALESNMAFVAEGLQKQLSQLKGQVLEPKKQEFQVKELSDLKGRVSTTPDREFQALMGLLDD